MFSSLAGAIGTDLNKLALKICGGFAEELVSSFAIALLMSYGG
jgi:hypothetical protein